MSQPSKIAMALALSPSGNLFLDEASGEEYLSQKDAETIKGFFEHGHQKGLLLLGLENFLEPLPPSFIYWQNFSQRFIIEVCHLPELSQAKLQSTLSKILVLKAEDLEEFLMQAPFMKGIEYLNVDVLAQFWNNLCAELSQQLTHYNGDIKALLKARNSSWNLVGRVYFHLAENKNSVETPFAFLATYTTRLSDTQAPKHMPLGRAFEEHAGEQNKSALLALLMPVQKASITSAFIKTLLESGDIFHPQAWTPHQAHCFLKDIPLIEASGVMIRVPNWWNIRTPPRPQVSVSIGEKETSFVGFDGMLDFKVKLTLSNGDELTDEEWNELFNSTESLIKIKGQWVEVDREQLNDVLAHWKNIQRQVKSDGLTFAEGLRMLSGASVSLESNRAANDTISQWSHVNAGGWLKEVLQSLRNPEHAQLVPMQAILENHLHATLRPYQMNGVKWLWLLYSLRLGGCLADDMGLGKTIQVIALLLIIKYERGARGPHLLVVPASLLGNWQAELKRFAPSLRTQFIHPSLNTHNDHGLFELENIDLVITTYSFLHRVPAFSEIHWDALFLDEAQIIKNPQTQQTQTAKSLKGNVRFLLTGTPVENRLSDLWSLFDFFAPGLLGSLKAFSEYSKKKQSDFYGTVRMLTSPYILRRLKSDKRIIADLPDKIEIPTFCTLTKKQASLYQQAVEELEMKLSTINPKERSGIIFNYLMRFKQLCNHPSQWLGYGGYPSSESGKFLRLGEICQEIAAKQEKVLIFTQFQEIIPALSDYVSTLFNREGLVLHGGTAIKKRTDLVKAFADEQGPPFFILSLKAGGTGLNLTNASHVIHFDRWWNPAVENQATDRAYRIGQKRNVIVYKFICQGTIEEKINQMITAKKTLSAEIIESGKEIVLTELTNEQLMNIIALDIHRACQES
jgi:non-specific serine/threonine protein kinase